MNGLDHDTFMELLRLTEAISGVASELEALAGQPSFRPLIEPGPVADKLRAILRNCSPLDSHLAVRWNAPPGGDGPAG